MRRTVQIKLQLLVSAVIVGDPNIPDFGENRLEKDGARTSSVERIQVENNRRKRGGEVIKWRANMSINDYVCHYPDW